ncbi:hypothetical protein BX592_104323 [Paraburkholderia rhizosphaerae]|uniref:Lysozyme n=1 Tax=Paraburkholderia rhizosphaerae TaxID=480658 RepID=A0A4R8LYI5_9BURK|nr:hypothetical protein BX592_104323 [Paraburkholderia rhizosphaerae]
MTKALCACTTSTDSSSMFTAYSSRHCKPWIVSTTGLEFIAVLESGVLNGKNYLGHQVTNGFVLEVYKDSKGLPTVGLGHLVNDSDKLNVGDTISMERAQGFLKKSLADIENASTAM